MNVKFKTDAQLEFIFKDCLEAIQANPDNPKVYQYLKEKTECQNELLRRERLRSTRTALKYYAPIDRLLCNLRTRHMVCNPDNRIKQFKDVCFSLGYYRKYGFI